MSFVETLNLNKYKYRERFPIIALADGSRPAVSGTISLPVSYDNKTKLVDFTIIPSISFAVILGIDFCFKFDLNLSFRDNLCQVLTNPCVSVVDVIDPNVSVINRIIDLDELTSLEKRRLSIVIDKYKTLASKAPGLTNLICHHIDTGDAKPIRQRQYAMSPAIQKHLHKEIDQMLKDDIIEPSNSPWCSPIVMVTKKDNTYRMCFDGRKVNEVTVRDSYPLPLIDSILSKLRDSAFLTSLDLTKAFWNIPLDVMSRPKTAFLVHGRGLFQFKRMPFGLCNSAQTMQRLVDQVLGPDLEKHVFVYLDDIIIATSSFDKHIEILNEVHKRLSKAGLKINIDKCKFCRESLSYLGFVIDKHGLRTDPDKVEGILKTQVPKNTTEVRRLMGILQWYRRFIKDFSTLSYPISSLLQGRKKGKPITWTKEADIAFQILKERLVSAPILASPDFDRPFVIQTDASDVGLGAVLFQEVEGFEHPIAYASRTLTKAEQKYSVTERECLAVLFGVEKFRCYVEGTDFEVITDHASLKWLYHLKDPIGRLARWCIRLSQFAFKIQHRKGSNNIVADFLSRNVCALQASEIKPDDWYVRMRQKITSHPDLYPDFRVEDGIIFKHFSPKHNVQSNLADWKIVLPTPNRQQIMSEHHDNAISGHFGTQRTWARVFEHYYWPGMRKDIHRFVKTCDVCGAHKSPQDSRAGLMGNYKNISFPFQLISVDLMGPFPRSKKGNTQLFVVIDWFTKFVLVQPMAKATSKSIIKFLENQVFLIFGVPQVIMCDNGPQFVAKDFKDFLKEYKVQHLWYNARYHSQVNPTERINKVIGTTLGAFIKNDHKLWDENVYKIAQAIRTSQHEVTGFTPAFLTFGRNVPLDGAYYGREIPTSPEEIEIANELSWQNDLKGLPKIFGQVRSRLRQAYETTRKRYNLRRRPITYTIGEVVWKKNFVLSDATKNFSKKLAPKYVKCLVTKIRGSGKVYELSDLDGRILGDFHVKDLKPYHERDSA